MIVDTSALVSIALEEPEADGLLATITSEVSPRMSAANLLEVHIVVDRRRNERASAILQDFLTRVALSIEPVNELQVELARDAYRRFGRGSGHPARLNYGDCFAYALARYTDEPLLFVGNDFAQTDIARLP